MTSTKTIRVLAVAALAFGHSFSAFGQAPETQQPPETPKVPAPAAPPDEVDQLAQMLNLTEQQQTEIRALIEKMTPQIEKLQEEAQAVQQNLHEKAGPDFKEKEIRELATQLGELTGKITAETVILQSKVQRIFTEEQRQELENLDRQRQQMQQQQMQQQMQQQLQQQMQQQQQQPQAPQGQQP